MYEYYYWVGKSYFSDFRIVAHNIIHNTCTTAQKYYKHKLLHIHTRTHSVWYLYARIIIGRPRENLSYCVPKRKTVTINLSVSDAIILHIIRLGGAARCVRDLNVGNTFRRPSDTASFTPIQTTVASPNQWKHDGRRCTIKASLLRIFFCHTRIKTYTEIENDY